MRRAASEQVAPTTSTSVDKVDTTTVVIGQGDRTVRARRDLACDVPAHSEVVVEDGWCPRSTVDAGGGDAPAGLKLRAPRAEVHGDDVALDGVEGQTRNSLGRPEWTSSVPPSWPNGGSYPSSLAVIWRLPVVTVPSPVMVSSWA